MIVVEIADNQQTFPIDRRWYTELARYTLAQESVTVGEVSIAFVDNATIGRLNRQFLAHDYPTDVITFPLSEPSEPLRAEIVISTEYASEECVHHGWPTHLEVGLYLVHGLLHLCGYDDGEPSTAQVMESRQAQVLEQFLEQINGSRDYNQLPEAPSSD